MKREIFVNDVLLFWGVLSLNSCNLEYSLNQTAVNDLIVRTTADVLWILNGSLT